MTIGKYAQEEFGTQELLWSRMSHGEDEETSYGA